MIDYKKLWIKLAEKGMKDRDLAQMAGVSIATVSRMRNGQPVSFITLYRISKVFNCRIEDLLNVNP